jgi:hypothetical protein
MTETTTLSIKNLSIAVEALSRVQAAEDLFDRLKKLLKEQISKMERIRDFQAPLPPPYTDNDIPF